MDVELTYLLNSGFLVRAGKTLFVFDDYSDPRHAVDQAVARGDFDRLYIFASHAHFDHFDPHIKLYEQAVTQYIFGYDIRHTKAVRSFPKSKTIFMPTYSRWEDEAITAESFDSTDAGVSFRVVLKENGLAIFHAGDFNWWDWDGEDRETRKLAENAFRKQMKKLRGMEADLAFFPVDGRLGVNLDKGAKEFCAETDVHALVTMHSVGYPAWQPPKDFFRPGGRIPVWSPREPGEKNVLRDGRLLK